MKRKAPIVVIEGLDASGKETQTRRLIQKMEEKGYKVWSIDFPGYDRTPAGKRLDEFLHGMIGNVFEIDTTMVMALYAADRMAHIPLIQEKQQEVDLIVLDRSVTANILFNRAKCKTPEEAEQMDSYNHRLEYELFGFPMEDMVIFFNASNEARSKMHKQKNRVADEHEKNKNLQNRVREEALIKCKQEERWNEIKVDHNGDLRTIDDIGDEVLQLVMNKLGFA